MRTYVLPIVILIMSAIYIFAIPSDPEYLKLTFKLIPMLLIIYYAYLQLQHIRGSRQLYHTLLIVGLFFCMLGDGLLRWFVIGLTAFLIGHLFYLTSFIQNWHYSKARFYTIIPLAVFAVFMSWNLVASLLDKGDAHLIAPVLLYIIVISLMTWTAIMTGNKWAIVGSILFTISDSILSWNMFISKVDLSHLLIMATYYGAQFCMASSIRTISQKKNSYTLKRVR